MEASAGVLNVTDTNLTYTADPVGFTYNSALSLGMNTVRAFGHGTVPAFPLQISPGNYSEAAFVALDKLIARAGQAGIKLLLTFGDNWMFADSKMNYLDWTGNTNNTNAFFTDSAVKQLYKNHIAKVTNRNNTVNGITYRNDPAIFAWDLMNEVRCECYPTTLYPAPPMIPECLPECADLVTAWVNEMAAYTKTQDPNHLLTVGIEGFYSEYDPQNVANPGNGWASLTGQNFTDQHSSPSIDFGAIHYWPDRWTLGQAPASPDFLQYWVGNHSLNMAALNKPLLLEEFGVEVEPPALPAGIARRNTFYQTIYNALTASVNSASGAASALRGAMFWKWDYVPVNANTDDLMVALDDTVITTVAQPAIKSIQTTVQGKTLASCIATSSSGSSATTSTSNLPSSGGTSSVSAAGRRLMQA
eukprot:jgi/Astpho2/4449/Aster-00059